MKKSAQSADLPVLSLSRGGKASKAQLHQHEHKPLHSIEMPSDYSSSVLIADSGKEFVYLRIVKPSKQQIKLAEKILSTKDKNILNHIQAVLENASQWENEIPDEIQKSIEQGLADVAAGRVTPHEEVMKKYEKWLRK